jgi:hypothetical protein
MGTRHRWDCCDQTYDGRVGHPWLMPLSNLGLTHPKPPPAWVAPPTRARGSVRSVEGEVHALEPGVSSPTAPIEGVPDLRHPTGHRGDVVRARLDQQGRAQGMQHPNDARRQAVLAEDTRGLGDDLGVRRAVRLSAEHPSGPREPTALIDEATSALGVAGGPAGHGLLDVGRPERAALADRTRRQPGLPLGREVVGPDVARAREGRVRPQRAAAVVGGQRRRRRLEHLE